MTHTDIKTNGWIGRFLPSPVRPYAWLARLDRPIGAWLLLLPGWWAIALAAGGIGIMTAADYQLLVLFFIGAIVMRAAGCTINDLWDRKLDVAVERTRNRPLAAGDISPAQALVFLAFLLLIGLVILLQLSLVAILLGVLAVPLIALYPLMKRLTWWPQLFLGLVFNFGALIGWSATTGVLSVPALLLYAAGIFWTLAYDTIYAHQDKEDDARIGIKSAALKLGDRSRNWISGFYIGFLALLVAAFVAAGAGWLSYIVIVAAAVHVYRIMKNWDESDKQSSLQAFKASRNTGLIVFLAALAA